MGTPRSNERADHVPRLVAIGFGVGAEALGRLGLMRTARRFVVADIEVIPTRRMTVVVTDPRATGHSASVDPTSATSEGGVSPSGPFVALAPDNEREWLESNRSAGLGESRQPGLFDGVDHLVLTTPNMEIELASLDRFGIAVRRESARHGRRQAFCWLATPTGRVILEVVEDPELSASTWWGVTLVSRDLRAVAGTWGRPADAVKPALQRGRHILTHPGLDEPGYSPARLAVMSPHVSESP